MSFISLLVFTRFFSLFDFHIERDGENKRGKRRCNDFPSHKGDALGRYSSLSCSHVGNIRYDDSLVIPAKAGEVLRWKQRKVPVIALEE